MPERLRPVSVMRGVHGWHLRMRAAIRRRPSIVRVTTAASMRSLSAGAIARPRLWLATVVARTRPQPVPRVVLRLAGPIRFAAVTPSAVGIPGCRDHAYVRPAGRGVEAADCVIAARRGDPEQTRRGDGRSLLHAAHGARRTDPDVALVERDRDVWCTGYGRCPRSAWRGGICRACRTSGARHGAACSRGAGDPAD